MFGRFFKAKPAPKEAIEFGRNFPPDARVGLEAFVSPSVRVLGWKQTCIGENSVLGDDTWLNVNFRESTDISIDIGANCFIGKRNFFSSGKLIKIGDYVLTGIDCHFLGSGHLFDTPFEPCITTGVTDDGVIVVGPNCWIGTSVTVMKDVRIGYGSVIGARSIVTKDVPPLSLVIGAPGRILKRFSISRNEWVPAEECSEESFPSEEEYLNVLEKFREKAGAYCRGSRIAGCADLGDL